jgi:flagellar L-ring protein precursor FlgH
VIRLAALVLAAASLPAGGESLYREDSWRGLTSDNKAFRRGDVLTVQVFENTTATASADTGTRRANNVRAELSHGGTSVGQTTLGVAGDFDGGGRTQRTNRLLTTVTVTVREVLPSGQLRIAGTQSIQVNDELQQVTLEGLVRPADISEANLVQSTRIADGRITYVGEGDVSDRSRRSWWRRLVDALGF